MMKKPTISILSLGLSLLCFSCNTYSQDNFPCYLKGVIDDNKFNGNVLIIKNDSVLFEISNGYAKPAQNDSLTQAYYFGIGSIQKEFPAVAIMLLKEKGALSVNDKISIYLPHLPKWAHKIRIKHLLQYASGLPRVNWKSYFSIGMMREKDVLADISKIKNLEFEPGTGYIYSNYNPMLLRAIVEQISGKNFRDYVQEDMLQSYGVEGIIIQEKFPFPDENQMAIPFNENFEVDAVEFEMFMIISTTHGMYNWFKKLDNFEIISKESLQFLSQEAIEGNNIQAPLGRGDWQNDELELHLHHGSSGNYEVLIRHYNQENMYIILLTNQKHGNLHEMADVIHEYY